MQQLQEAPLEAEVPSSEPIETPDLLGVPAPKELSADEPTRMERISAAYAAWHDELKQIADAVERPSSPLDPAIIDLTHPHPTGASELYSGKPTLLSSVIREEASRQRAHQRLMGLRSRIETLSEQYGYAPVTLAVGRMSWTELPESPQGADLGAVYAETGELHLSDSVEMTALNGVNSQALPTTPEPTVSAEAAAVGGGEMREIVEMHEPALLRTARLEPVGSDDAYITLTARSEVNPAVLRALRAHGIRAEEISKLRTLASDAAREDEAMARLRDLGRAYLPGFAYEDSALLGNFIHPGQVLLADLEAMKPYIETSGIMAALAGDPATTRLSAAPLPPAAKDDRAPEAERGAGDRDPQELAVVEAVASGRSLVVDTPPGSDTVGTLAAIVADAAASGRSVLYVPGRASGARALIDELTRLGLGDLVLDFSDLDTVAHRLRTGLRLHPGEDDAERALEVRAKLTQSRRSLRRYVSSVHEVDPRWNASLSDVLERLAELTGTPEPPKSRVRLDPDTLEILLGTRGEVEDLFVEAAQLGAFADIDASPWSGANVRQVEAGDRAIKRARRLATETLPVVMAQSQRAAGETGLRPAGTFEAWLEQIEVLTGISRSLDIFLPQIYERSAQDMVIATATKEWREKHDESMKGSERRRLTKQAKDMLRPGASSDNLHADLVTVQHQREVWRRYSTEGGWPKLPDGMAQIRATSEEASAELEALEEILPGAPLRQLPLGELLERLRALAADEDTMSRLPKANEAVDDLRSRGLGAVVDDFAGRGITADAIAAELDLVAASSIFEQLVAKSPELAAATPTELAQLAGDVREYDAEHARTLAGPVGRAVVRIMRETIAKRRDDTLQLDAQLQRYSTGGLRDAIATYPRLVQVARPVWVIPSMMTAEFVPPMPWADLVVMDDQDATSLAPAVSMLMRGRQIAVLGDTRRSAFEGSDAAITDFARVLPVCELPTLRAQHDELATETLREQGYGEILSMIPAAKRGRKPRVIVVDGRGVPNRNTGMIEGTQAEVDAVVDAVVEHALTRSEESLAVVSVSTVHAARIRDALKKLAVDSPDLQRFMAGQGTEPFTVVELTKAGGIRRDCVILTLGFGKTVHGRVLHSFGTLATPSGLTGLVDTVGAARTELTLITCIGPGELGSSMTSTPGPRMLEQLIDRAGGREIRLEPDSLGEPNGALLCDLAKRIRHAGFDVAAGYGYDEGMRIPLVAGDRTLPGTWRVAILIDDAEYVAEPSLRRRDRYWLERLEARGWRVVRTFVTSLFIDPAAEAERVIKLMREIRHEELPEAVAVPILEDDVDVPVTTSTERPGRPRVKPGMPLAAYTDDQLDDLVVWIASDGRERSRPEFIEDLRRELAIDRRGAQFDAILGNVVDRSGLAVSLNLGSDDEPEQTLGTIEPSRGADA